MNPRQRRLRRQRRKARVRDAEEARLELIEFNRKYGPIQRKIANHFEARAKQAGSEVLTRTTDWHPPPPVHDPALYPVDPQADIGPAISPKPTGGARLAAMLKGEKI
jgi:hypothetical protein